MFVTLPHKRVSPSAHSASGQARIQEQPEHLGSLADDVNKLLAKSGFATTDAAVRVTMRLLKQRVAAALASEEQLLVLAHHVPRHIVTAFLAASESKTDEFSCFKVWVVGDHPQHADLILTKDPSGPHSLGATRIISLLSNSIAANFGLEVQGILGFSTDIRVTLPTIPPICKEPDAGLWVEAGLDAGGAPPLVVENAFENETYGQLLKEGRAWMLHGSVQVTMLQKIRKRDAEPASKAPYMYFWALWKTTGGICCLGPVNFGAGSACTTPGMTAFSVKIVMDFLLAGAVENINLPNAINTACTIDLYNVRLWVFKWLRLDPTGLHETDSRSHNKAKQVTQDFCTAQGIHLFSPENAAAFPPGMRCYVGM